MLLHTIELRRLITNNFISFYIDVSILAERYNCVAETDYCRHMSSVCVTRVYCDKTTEASIKWFSQSSSTALCLSF